MAHEKPRYQNQFVDLIGRRFGLLIVTHRDGTRWACICDCGATTLVHPGDLNRGSARSCGCRSHPRRADATYLTVHERLRTDRGSARQYECSNCASPAFHWAYDHTDPDELMSAYGAYSLNPERYHPYCVPCHKAFDLQIHGVRHGMGSEETRPI